MKKEEKAPETPILAQLKEYLETQLKLVKLNAIDKGSSYAGDQVIDLIKVI